MGRHIRLIEFWLGFFLFPNFVLSITQIWQKQHKDGMQQIFNVVGWDKVLHKGGYLRWRVSTVCWAYVTPDANPLVNLVHAGVNYKHLSSQRTS